MQLLEYVKSKPGMASALARELGITPTLISQWAHGVRRVPAERCLDIETATSAQVTRYDLRPDVFGTGPAAAPVEEPDPDANRIEPVETP